MFQVSDLSQDSPSKQEPSVEKGGIIYPRTPFQSLGVLIFSFVTVILFSYSKLLK